MLRSLTKRKKVVSPELMRLWVMRCDCIDLDIEYQDRTNMSLPVARLVRDYKVIGSSD